jgi:hypothetical protein
MKPTVAKIAQVNAGKIERLSRGQLKDEDLFICSHCLERYGNFSRQDKLMDLPLEVTAESS